MTRVRVLALLTLLVFSKPARACTNDAECPNPACGGDICNWYPPEANICRPAGLHPKGMDGWCTVDTDCKCYPQGARCIVTQCAFTTLAEAPVVDAGATADGGSTDGTQEVTPGTTGGSNQSGCSVAAAPEPEPTHAPALTLGRLLALGLLGAVAVARSTRRISARPEGAPPRTTATCRPRARSR